MAQRHPLTVVPFGVPTGLGATGAAEAAEGRRGAALRGTDARIENKHGVSVIYWNSMEYIYIYANGSAATCTVQHVHIYIYHMYFGSRIKRLEKVRFPFRRYAAYGPSVIASNYAD